MVSITTKRIKGREYLYLVHSIRKNNKVVQKTVKYIGKKRPIPKEEFECMKISYENRDWVLKFKDELSYKDHETMKKASDNYKKYLKTLDNISKEKEREKFLSKFIADSNAIEGSTLTARDTFNFLFKDVAPEGYSKKELFMAVNMLKAWIYVEENQTRFPNEDDIKTLHRLVNKEVETDKTLGKYKQVQNYVGEVYTSSYLFVKEKMNKLMRWIKQAYNKVNDFEVAFQSHAQFEIIHPFIDGNGRVGRLLLNWLLMYKGLMPFAIRKEKRSEYISALLNSQRGKIAAICKFCCDEYVQQHKFI